MATIAGGYKVNAAIAVNNQVSRSSVGTTTGTWYTAPSNGFAIITLSALSTAVSSASSGGSSAITIGGIPVCTQAAGTVATVYFGGSPNSASSTGPIPPIIYLGPGQSISYDLTISGIAGAMTATARLFGVEYINA
jgi:hypothetical protein